MLSLSASLWICIGGAIGAWLRVSAITMVALAYPGTPFGMAVVNILGSFCIGLLYAPLSSIHLVWLKYCLIGGLLGSLTTFSTYALDVFLLIQQKKVLQAVAYSSILPLLAIVSVYCGDALSRRLF